MPKLESPFVRRKNDKGNFVVFPEIAEGYSWVLVDEQVLATEKLPGTNILTVLRDGRIKSIWNRGEEIPFFRGTHRRLIDGLLNAFPRGYCSLPDGQWFGELIGPEIDGNHLNLDENLWIPFDTYAREKLSYKSWGKHPKTFEGISEWFKDGPRSLMMLMRGIKDVKVEGVVFVQPSTGKMAKLRRDMFDWYDGRGHKEAK